ncbi:MAG: helix-turn-helix domain-containing protein [Phycisphaerales bacterium]|nr:helix-turn-helix domain-containing protein [Phycisphaerales bacterium]
MEMLRHAERTRPLIEPGHGLENAATTAVFDHDEDLVKPPVEWPSKPHVFPELRTPVKAARYLRLDEGGYRTPNGVVRTLKHWRDQGELKATKFARRVLSRRVELDRFLVVKTEQ